MLFFGVELKPLASIDKRWRAYGIFNIKYILLGLSKICFSSSFSNPYNLYPTFRQFNIIYLITYSIYLFVAFINGVSVRSPVYITIYVLKTAR